jgi:hypothetical protein
MNPMVARAAACAGQASGERDPGSAAGLASPACPTSIPVMPAWIAAQESFQKALPNSPGQPSFESRGVTHQQVRPGLGEPRAT